MYWTISDTCMNDFMHMQISKYVRKEMPDVVHKFDVWHVAKVYNVGSTVVRIVI